jgi:hypothetical protein
VNARLVTVLSDADDLEIFLPDPPRSYTFLARLPSWSEASDLFRCLVSPFLPITLVVTGTPPPVAFIRRIAPLLDSYVFVPSCWLDFAPSSSSSRRARIAAHLAATHLSHPINVDYFRDNSTSDDSDHNFLAASDDLPF